MDRQNVNQDELDPQLDPQLDPELDALLDRILAAENAPADLTDRIMARTTGLLGRQQGPLARIGPWLRTAAAVLILGAWTGVWMTGGDIYIQAKALARLDRIEQRIDADLTQLETAVAQEPVEVLAVEHSTDDLLDALIDIRNELDLDSDDAQF
jgi:hypothetical protein